MSISHASHPAIRRSLAGLIVSVLAALGMVLGATAAVVVGVAGPAAASWMMRLPPWPPDGPPPPPGDTDGSGYVWNHIAADYTPTGFYAHPTYSDNSTGGLNQIYHDATGEYTVWFPYLRPDGVAHVTAYTDSSVHCAVKQRQAATVWTGGGTDVMVRCRKGGQPVDAMFDVSYLVAGRGVDALAGEETRGAYVLGGGAHSEPIPADQYNSRGGVNRVERLAAGYYQVAMPGLATVGGHVQVTAYGPGVQWCSSMGWGPYGDTQVAYVRCFGEGAAPVDSTFTLSYVEHTSLLLDAEPSGYAWADRPTADSYAPHPAYAYDTHPALPIEIRRHGVGIYQVSVPVPLDRGHVQVTAYGSTAHCAVMFWSQFTGVWITCFGPTGSRVDSRYDVAVLSRPENK